jgi:hypothetical protein
VSAVTTSSRPVALGALARRGALAALVAALLNVVVSRIAAALLDVPGDYGPLQVGPVATFTIVAVLAGTAVYALLTRRTAQPGRVFRIVAWAFAVVSAVPTVLLLVTDQPLLEGSQPAAGATVAATVLLHAIPAAVIVGLLTRTFGRRSPS